MSENSINAPVKSLASSQGISPIPPLAPYESPAPLSVQLCVATPYPTPELLESYTGAAIYTAIQTATSIP